MSENCDWCIFFRQYFFLFTFCSDFFFQFYWDIIDIRHWVSLRRMYNGATLPLLWTLYSSAKILSCLALTIKAITQKTLPDIFSVNKKSHVPLPHPLLWDVPRSLKCSERVGHTRRKANLSTLGPFCRCQNWFRILKCLGTPGWFSQ